MDDELMGRYFKAMQAELRARENSYQHHDILLGSEASYVIDYARTKDARLLPLRRLLCANVRSEKSENCNQPGTMVCSKCRLVSYCSKECQVLHWTTHKQDCKNRFLSKNWRPCWAEEGRSPSFLSTKPELQPQERYDMQDYSIGLPLWGNMPAMDIVNLPNNEADSTRDLSLAFIASGDLRHVVRTINALPSDYSGNLKVLINDKIPHVACRSMVLLIMLGAISDDVLAADIALHFWYSAFLPYDYRLKITGKVMEILRWRVAEDSKGLPFPLGPRSTLTLGIPLESIEAAFPNLSTYLSTTETRARYNRMRNAPSRQDFRDRMYANLRPSHRVAFQKYRRSGVVLPFGAANAHFDIPNPTLFSGDAEWLQTDFADPLCGWDLEEVIKAGRAHGAQAEDIYGCLYFFLLDELSSFSRRLQQLRITFNLYNVDASDLSLAIRSNLFAQDGISKSIRFDRIEVANILDANYVGIRGVLSSWVPLLLKSSSATILGYFMNWTMLQEDGDITTGKNQRAMQRLVRAWATKMKAEGRPGDSTQLFTTSLPDLNALYENSGPFMQYLKKQGLDSILLSTELKLRQRHTIIPHRFRAPLSGPLDALPEFPDRDSWYYHTQVMIATWTERFVEFVHA